MKQSIVSKNPKQKIAKLNHNGTEVITVSGKVYVPEKYSEALVEWFHENLQHPGKERMICTIRNNFIWIGWTSQIEKYVANCHQCREFKITGTKKYGKIPLRMDGKEEIEPWASVHIDCAGEWAVNFKHVPSGKIIAKKILTLTAVDQGTGFPEIWPLKDRSRKKIRYGVVMSLSVSETSYF